MAEMNGGSPQKRKAAEVEEDSDDDDDSDEGELYRVFLFHVC
jgi:hypothetical protein